MGHLKDIANQPSLQTFPNSTFQIAGDVPAAQCTDASRSTTNGNTTSIPPQLNSFGIAAFANLSGDICRITVSPTGNTGDFLITSNASNFLNLGADPGDSVGVHAHVIAADPPTHTSELAETRSVPPQLRDIGAYAGWDLTDRICVITESPTGNTGNFPIDSNNANQLFFTPNPGDSLNVHYYIKANIDLTTPRTLQDFVDYITAAGYSYTIKGGKLYTNIPSATLQNACLIIFNPLT